MAHKTQVEGVAQYVMYELNRWSEEKTDKIKAYTKNMAYEGMRKLRNVDMSGISEGRSWLKHYSKNWRVADKSGTNYASYVIHNGSKKDPTYRLTHLLEKGHRTRFGGRTRAFVHIQPVADEAVKEYYEGLERILQGKE